MVGQRLLSDKRQASVVSISRVQLLAYLLQCMYAKRLQASMVHGISAMILLNYNLCLYQRRFQKHVEKWWLYCCLKNSRKGDVAISSWFGSTDSTMDTSDWINEWGQVCWEFYATILASDYLVVRTELDRLLGFILGFWPGLNQNVAAWYADFLILWKPMNDHSISKSFEFGRISWVPSTPPVPQISVDTELHISQAARIWLGIRIYHLSYWLPVNWVENARYWPFSPLFSENIFAMRRHYVGPF